jgi:hypothetical protein
MASNISQMALNVSQMASNTSKIALNASKMVSDTSKMALNIPKMVSSISKMASIDSKIVSNASKIVLNPFEHIMIKKEIGQRKPTHPSLHAKAHLQLTQATRKSLKLQKSLAVHPTPPHQETAVLRLRKLIIFA